MNPSLRSFAARLYSRLNGSTLAIDGRNNCIELSDSIRRRCHIRIAGNRNRVEFGPQCRLWDLHLEIVGDDHRLTVDHNCEVRGGHWLLEDRGSRILIGAKTTLIDGTLVASEGRAIVLSEDCMLGANVEIRCSDGHSILDEKTRARINPPADVTLATHVWLGSAVRVLKGVSIGRNTIVAAGAIVTRDLPESCVAAGIPARCVREGVNWGRERITPETDS